MSWVRRATACFVVAVLVAACARSEASEMQVQARAEQITALLLSGASTVPRYQDDIVRSEPIGADLDLDGPWRFWEVHVNVELAQDSPTSPAQVRDEMVRLLLTDGWTEDDRDDPISGGIDTFRKHDLGGSWSVELGAWETPPPSPQRVFFWVGSPRVNR
jgi:hypothetical protein